MGLQEEANNQSEKVKEFRVKNNELIQKLAETNAQIRDDHSKVESSENQMLRERQALEDRVKNMEGAIQIA